MFCILNPISPLQKVELRSAKCLTTRLDALSPFLFLGHTPSKLFLVLAPIQESFRRLKDVVDMEALNHGTHIEGRNAWYIVFSIAPFECPCPLRPTDPMSSSDCCDELRLNSHSLQLTEGSTRGNRLTIRPLSSTRWTSKRFCSRWMPVTSGCGRKCGPWQSSGKR